MSTTTKGPHRSFVWREFRSHQPEGLADFSPGQRPGRAMAVCDLSPVGAKLVRGVAPFQGLLHAWPLNTQGVALGSDLVCRACSTAWRCKSSTQRDGVKGWRRARASWRHGA